jgi:hypothetical protein
MKSWIKRLLLALTTLSFTACSPNNPTTVTIENGETAYTLDWKIASGEMLAYKTAMNRAEDSNPTVSFNLDQIFTDDANLNSLSQQFSNLRLPEVSSLISILEPNTRGNISVRMILDDVSTPDDLATDELSQSFNQMMQKMEGTVQLRGELTPDGAISSFYLEQQQRNLLAIFFELPTGSVQVGDSWPLTFNCIALGQQFIPNNVNKINQVTLTEISQTADGKPVAVLDYVLIETVDGNFQSPMTNEATPTAMTCSFLGRGRFLIESGRWEQLLGEFAVTSSGIMETNTIQRFALTPLLEIPEIYRNQS